MTDCPRCGQAAIGAVSTSPGIEQFAPCGCRIAIDGGRDPYIRFADHHVDALLSGEKTLTVRIDFERDLSLGDDVDLVDETGQRFATATIATVGEMTALKFVEQDPDGHRSYRSVAELAEHLRQYYDDVDFWPGTRVHVIRLEDVEAAEKRVATDGGSLHDEDDGTGARSVDGIERPGLSLNPVVPAGVRDPSSVDAYSPRPQGACLHLDQIRRRSRIPDTQLEPSVFPLPSLLNIQIWALFTTIGRQLTELLYPAQSRNYRSIDTETDQGGDSGK